MHIDILITSRAHSFFSVIMPNAEFFLRSRCLKFNFYYRISEVKQTTTKSSIMGAPWKWEQLQLHQTEAYHNLKYQIQNDTTENQEAFHLENTCVWYMLNWWFKHKTPYLCCMTWVSFVASLLLMHFTLPFVYTDIICALLTGKCICTSDTNKKRAEIIHSRRPSANKWRVGQTRRY